MADLIPMLGAAAGAAAGGGEVDPNFNQTVLLLHGDGTNGAQNNTFVDSSTNGFTVTRNGNATQGTFSPFSAPDGRWSNYFDGSGDYLNWTGTDCNVGVWTLEAWIFPTANGGGSFGGRGIISCGDVFLNMGFDGSNKITLRWYTGSAGYSISSTTVLALNTWYHVAVIWESNTSAKVFINGVLENSTASNLTIASSTSWKIGREGDQASYFTGYISNARVSSAILYSSNFTPSTTPLTVGANTNTLTCQSNRFVDNSSNAFAITRNGNVKVTPFSPFAPTTAYSPSVNGGSGYFDGSGDTVRTTTTQMLPATDTFTLEGWFYPTNPTGSDIVFSQANNAVPQGNRIYLYFLDTGKLYLGLNDPFSPTLTSTNNYQLNAWNHWAVTRSGSTYTVYLNGVSEGTASSANSLVNDVLVIGGNITLNGQEANGYISDVRLNLELVYTGAYTIPSAPLTATANTKLLLNFTNAGIFDNTGKNNLETVGNAQIDTTTKKFGTGSMEFDGTGDKLKIPYTPDLVLGTGSFSIEFWIYRNNTTGDMAILDARPSGSTDGWSIFLNSTNKVVFSAAGSNQATGTTTISSGTWYYIAITRSGSTLKIFVDGVEDASVTSSADAKATEGLTIGTKQYTSSGQIDFNGFLDEVRVTKGIARTISLPTKAFPDL